jgi:hypothetical protein
VLRNQHYVLKQLMQKGPLKLSVALPPGVAGDAEASELPEAALVLFRGAAGARVRRELREAAGGGGEEPRGLFAYNLALLRLLQATLSPKPRSANPPPPSPLPPVLTGHVSSLPRTNWTRLDSRGVLVPAATLPAHAPRSRAQRRAQRVTSAPRGARLGRLSSRSATLRFLRGSGCCCRPPRSRTTCYRRTLSPLHARVCCS